MPYAWPVDSDPALWELGVLERDCPACGRRMHVCAHRHRRLHTLTGPVQLVCKLDHCPDPACSGHFKTKSPEIEITIALPKRVIGWDVLCWIGHRRCSRHWSIPQIQGELRDAYGIALSEDSLARYIRHYQVMLAARQQDPDNLRREYGSVEQIVLTIDGLQPEGSTGWGPGSAGKAGSLPPSRRTPCAQWGSRTKPAERPSASVGQPPRSFLDHEHEDVCCRRPGRLRWHTLRRGGTVAVAPS